MQLQLIKANSTGPLVKAWQFFLTGQGLYHDEVDGKFGPNTRQASIDFQLRHGLQPDGVVGNKTFGIAMSLGFEGVEDKRTDISGSNFPAKPTFNALTGNAQRQHVFGTFTFVHEPVRGNPENIRITNNWANDNIITVPIPQLKNIGFTSMQFHKMAASQLQKLWKGWQDAGLLHFVLTYSGSYVARFIRGSRSVLSNHAFGTAFDINVPWNGLGVVPALVGQKGCVRELVSIANDNGFYWGGHFSRLDGMHFEVAKLM